MDLQGWATLENLTQTSFKDAALSVIAGYVGQINNNYYGYNPEQTEYTTFYYQRRNTLMQQRNQHRNVVKAGNQASSQERVGDNLIYRLPYKTTLAAKQKKQISLVEASGVEARKGYEFYNHGFNNGGRVQKTPIYNISGSQAISSDNPRSVESRIRFSNSRETGLGEALPAGTIRVYTKDKLGRSQFIGEEQISHIAGGSDMSIKIGEAFDITVKPTLKSAENISKKITEYEMDFDLRNASKKEVTIRLYQKLNGYSYDYKFLSESQTGENKDANWRYCDIAIPAEGKSELNFKVREDRTR